MRKRFYQLGLAGLALLLLAIPLFAQTAASPGTNPAQWRAKFNLFANKMHKNIFPGVDLIYSGSSVRLNAQLIVQPGASLDAIRLDLAGAQQTQVGEEVQAQLPADKLAMRLLPVQAFQALKGAKHDLEGSFVQREDGSVGIAVKEYNAKQPLIITLVAVFQAITPAKESAALAKGGAPTISTPPGPIVTATKTDEVIPDDDSDGSAIPGETIKYTVTIDNTGSAEATNTVYNDNVDPNTTFTPGSLKMSPLAFADNYSTQPNTPISRSTSDPDDLLDNDNLGVPAATIASFGGGTLGGVVTDHAAGATANVSGHSLTVNANGSFNYSPASGFTGNFTFSYRLGNSTGTDDAVVTIGVQAGPSAVADNYFTPVNTTLSRSTSDPDDLLDNDNLGSPAATLTSFGGGSLSGDASTNAAGTSVAFAGGMLQVNSDGSFTLTTPTTTGSFTFQYRLTNVSGTSDATVTIEVRQAPNAVNDSYNTLVNNTLSVSAPGVMGNDTRGFPLADVTHFGVSSVTDNLAGASIAFAGGMLQVNSDGSFSLTTPTTTGSFTFDYRIGNSSGTSDATVTIEVRKAPTAVNDGPYTVSTGGTLTVSAGSGPPDGLLVNDDRGFPLANLASFGGGSLSGDATTNAAGASVAFAGGMLQVNSDGSFSLTTPTTAGSFTFQYRLSNVVNFSDATVTIEVQGPPLAVDDPNGGLPGNSTPSNDVPVAGTDHPYHTALNTALSVPDGADDLLANDNLGFPAGAIFSYGTTGNPAAQTTIGASTPTDQGGTVTVQANGSFSYTPPSATFTGLDQFAYRLQNVVGNDDATVTVAVGKRPTAVADSRTATGNVRLSTAVNLLTNDIGDQLTVTAFDATSVQGGNVTVTAVGAFTYNPPPGYEGSDSFTYTVGNGFGNGPAGTVTITISGMIWFIDNTAASCVALSSGCGRLTNPFSTLAAFQAINDGIGNDPAPGDNIFIYTGSGSYTGGVTLRNNQKLIGQGASGTLEAIAGITLAPGSDALPTLSGADPVIENSSGDGIILSQTNTIRGLNLGNCSGFGIVNNGGAGTLTVSEVDINNTTGGGFRTDAGGTLAVTLGSVTSTGGVYGIYLAGTGGSFSVTGATNITNSANVALRISSSGTNAGFAAITIGNTASGFESLLLANNTGTFNASGATTINAPAAGSAASLSISSGTGNITFSGIDINGRRDIGIHISGGNWTINTGAVNIDNANSATDPAIDIAANSGTINFGDTDIDNNGANGIAVEIQGATGPISFAAGSSITGANGNEDFKVHQGNANITYNGTINNTAGTAVIVTGRTGGTIDFQGNITHNAAATAINVGTAGAGQNNSGGTVRFSGTSKSLTSSTATAVNLVSNTGATVEFTNGGLGITTTGGTGFNATGGGTVNVTGSSNTITSQTGTALNVANTTIGASGLTFQSISSSSGSPTGIILDNTGTSGGLTVTGTGTAGSGGTIANKTGANGSTTTGIGIYLNSTSSVSLTRMQLNDCQNYAIRGNSVTGFTLSNCVINGANGNNSGEGASNEGSIRFDNLLGSASISSCTVTGGSYDNVSVFNSTGSLDRLTISSTTLATSTSATADDALRFESSSGAITMNITVQNCTFTTARGDLFNSIANGSPAMDVVFTGNTCSNNHPSILSAGGGITIAGSSVGFSPTVTYNVSGSNTFRDALGNAITIFKGNGGGTFSGTVENNTIGTAANLSGSAQASGIRLTTSGTGTHTTRINSNTIQQYNEAGIFVLLTDGSATMNATITNNSTTAFSGGGTFAFAGLWVDCGALPTDSHFLCASITGNNFSAGDPFNAGDIYLNQNALTTIRLPSYVGANNATCTSPTVCAVNTFVIGNNSTGTPTMSSVDNVAGGGGGFVGGAACPTP